jgi:hypothetical protein
VREHAHGVDGYAGAFLSGSTTWLDDAALLPMGSDVDVMVVVDDRTGGTGGECAAGNGTVPPKLGKFGHGGVVLEVTYQPRSRLSSVEVVLASYHLAGAFRRDHVLADPGGWLRALQREVGRRYADPDWVIARRADARARIERGLAAVGTQDSFAERVTGWLFPTGVTTHVLLVAALRNPTIRLRYIAARDVLVEFGQSGMHDELLRLLGSADLSRERAAHHVRALARAFDLAAGVGTTPFPYSGDISPAARSIAIDAAWRLLEAGDHREAMFWIVATFARCQTILDTDAPELAEHTAVDFTAAAADLGITDDADMRARAEAVLAFLPELWRVSAAIQAAAVATYRRM